MAHYSMKCVFSLMVWTLATLCSPMVWAADDLDSIRFGENALAYSSGSIQRSTPQDGFVNVITGDNQTTGDHMILGSRDILYLRLKNSSEVVPGDLFTIYKRAHKVFHPTTGQYLGHLVNRLAVARVTQIDQVLTTVEIVRAYATVSPGDPVMKFSPPPNANEEAAAGQPSTGDVEGRVVEFQSNLGIMNMVAQRNIVYLDRGREDGIRTGDRMDVIRTGGNLPQRVVGELKILSLEDRTATALITKSLSRILKGDRFRVKIQAPGIMPVSQSSQQSPDISPALAPSPKKLQVQNVARETQISLSDLMKQLRFESGEVTIKPEGYQVLDELIAYLKANAGDRLIRVEGHADNREIGPSLKSLYRTNWDLSKARAGVVLRYLIEKGGIDSANLSSAGYGDTKPMASNATEAGRQKNRRVDIVLYSPASTKEQSEPTAKSIENNETSYNLSRLGSEESGAPISALDTTTQVAPTDPSKADPSSVPAEPTPTTIPPIAGQDRADQNPATSVTPPQ